MGLYSDIRSASVSVSGSPEAGILALFNFPGTLALFRGHFPGNPILPGIAQVEMVRIALETAVERSLTVRAVNKTKFSHLIEPDSPVTVSITVLSSGQDDSGTMTWTVRASVRTGDTAAGRITLELAEI